MVLCITQRQKVFSFKIMIYFSYSFYSLENLFSLEKPFMEQKVSFNCTVLVNRSCMKGIVSFWISAFSFIF